MSIDRWLDEGFGGEARRQYDERLSVPDRPRDAPGGRRTRQQEAELAQVEREKAELRRRLGLTADERFNELMAFVLGPRPEE